MTDHPKRTILDQTRRVFILLVGVTILAVGALLLVLPGPGMLIILGGLALLALEFEWARGTLTKLREKLNRRKAKETSGHDESPAD